eukprot:GFYU01010600.1.p1 GENE.GFYU01010600.1~~GFYU01010600.1.p1  ORF type:complete len:640 (+),score=126.69 GFYU01010600.1:458-2377(+)
MLPCHQTTICGASITAFTLNIARRHPYKNKPLIEYDLALFMEPCTLIGTSLGVLFNVLFSVDTVVATMLLSLIVISFLTFRKGYLLRVQEGRLADHRVRVAARRRTRSSSGGSRSGREKARASPHPLQPPTTNAGADADLIVFDDEQAVQRMRYTERDGWSDHGLSDTECHDADVSNSVTMTLITRDNGRANDTGVSRWDDAKTPDRRLGGHRGVIGDDEILSADSEASSDGRSDTSDDWKNESDLMWSSPIDGNTMVNNATANTSHMRGVHYQADTSRMSYQDYEYVSPVAPSSHIKFRSLVLDEIASTGRRRASMPSPEDGIVHRRGANSDGDIECATSGYHRAHIAFNPHNPLTDTDHNMTMLHYRYARDRRRGDQPQGVSDDDTFADFDHPSNDELVEIQVTERRIPYQKIALLASIWMFVLLTSLARGGHGVASILQIPSCSSQYWVVSAVFIPLPVIATIWTRQQLKRECIRKLNLGYQFKDGDIDWISDGCVVYPVVGVVIGAVSALLGVGTGIFRAPLLLHMNILPQVAAATSSFMIMFTSSATTIQYLIMGRLHYAQGIWYCAIGALASITGNILINRYVSQAGRASYIILTVAGVLALSTVLLATSGILQQVLILRSEEGMHHTGPMCD